MTWVATADLLGLACLFVGALSCLTSAIGLLRLPGAYLRMHAATKPQALGVLLVLVGVGLRQRSGSDIGMLVLAGCFQLITIPVSSHLLAQAQYRTGDNPAEGRSVYARASGQDDPSDDSARRPPRVR